MMIDTGASMTLVTAGWAQAHGLKVTPKPGLMVRGANGQNLKMLGVTSCTLQLAPTLEVDVADVAVCDGTFYQGLMGCDLL